MPEHNRPPSPSDVGGLPAVPDRVDLTSDFSSSNPEASASVSTSASAPAIKASRYQLLDEIARGGMGIIWRATDTTLDREVAIKVLQDRFAPDSGSARRFASEARITAQLQHPAIPPIHDFDKLPDDRPFLAMKLIKGRTLEELLRQRADPSAERGRFVAVFEQLCQAVAYAHAHNVIHRDLKPANVMVGGFGEVQVMDWGLAKLLTAKTIPATTDTDAGETVGGTIIHGSDADGSDPSFTQAGSILGTLAFMPPEQAAGEIAKVDQRSDVFGLGAILTVILTGTPPYTGTDTETVRVMAIRGELADCLARLDGCGAESELVALCKRCLAFAPAGRPRDAGAVAEEVAGLRAAAEERARAAERERAAAEARAAEQRRKRRWQLAAAATVVLALLAGLGGLAAFLQAQKQTNAELQAARDREHERFELAMEAIKTFHTGVSEDVLLKEEQFKSLQDRLLREAAQFYGKLQKMLEDQPDPFSQRALAQSYHLLADLTGKIGSLEEALAGHRRALALRRQLAVRGEPDAQLEVARSLLALGNCLSECGDDVGTRTAVEEARALAETAGASDEALAVLAESHAWLGIVSFRMQDWKEYLRHCEKSLEIRQRLADANPSDASRRQKRAMAYGDVAIALDKLGKDTEALQAYQKAIEISEKESRANPGDARLHDSLAKDHYNKGRKLGIMGQHKEAVSEYKKAVTIEQEAIDANPAVGMYKNNQAFFGNGLGSLLQQQGRSEEALQEYHKAAKTLELLTDAHPTTINYLRNLATSRASIAYLLVDLGRSAEALQDLDKAYLLYRKLVDAQPTQWKPQLANVARYRGIIRQKLGRPSEAVTAYRESISVLEGLSKPEPVDLYNLACAYALMHGIALEKGNGLTKEEAEAVAEKAMTTLRRSITAGYRDLANMRKDTDIDSLRKRPDFQKLMAELEKEIKASGK